MSFEIGTQKIETKIVQPEDSAMKVGSGLVDVFSTPSLIAFCEKTSSDLVKEWLQPNQVTVGIEINLKHVAASKIGATVKCISKLINVEGKILTFNINAFENEKLIGTGIHKRCIVDKQKFIDRLK